MRTLKERKEFLASLPFVKSIDAMPRLGTNLPPCQGIKWGTVALKDIFQMRKDGPPPRGFQDRSKCKKKAHWRFTAKGSRDKWAHLATSGDYCWSHLVQQLQYPVEETRINAAWEQWKADHPEGENDAR